MRVSSLGAVVLAAAALAACHGGGSGGGAPPPPSGPTYTVGGAVSGLAGSGLVLRNNGGTNLPLTASGAFTFTTALADGAPYAVTVQTQPSAPTQSCVVGNGSGTIAAANVTNVTVTCTTLSFRVGGTVTGLTATGLMLRDVVTDVTIPVSSGSTAFQFPAAVTSGGTYFVVIAAQPGSASGQVCALGNAAGVVGGADVTSIGVVCNSGAAKFVYVPDNTSSSVAALRVNAVNGTLSTVPGSPFVTGAGPQAMVATPSGAFVYVQSPATGRVSAFAVDAASGALTPVAGSPFSVTGGNASLPVMFLDPSGRFLYTEQSGSARFFGHAIDPGTGALAAIPGSPFNTPVGTAWLGFDKFGRYAYSVGGGAGGTSAAYRLDGATGALTAVGTPVATPTQNVPTGVVHPGGAFLYATDGTRVHALKIDLATGQLASAGTATAGGRYARVDPLGRFLYLTGGNAVDGFAIASQTGVLAPIAGLPVAAGTQTEDFDLEPTGNYLYVPSVLGQGLLSGFRIDATTGELAQVPGLPLVFGTGTNPSVARVDASGRSLFVSSFGDDKVRKFSIDLASGALTLVATASLPNVGSQGFILVGTQ